MNTPDLTLPPPPATEPAAQPPPAEFDVLGHMRALIAAENLPGLQLGVFTALSGYYSASLALSSQSDAYHASDVRGFAPAIAGLRDTLARASRDPKRLLLRAAELEAEAAQLRARAGFPATTPEAAA